MVAAKKAGWVRAPTLRNFTSASGFDPRDRSSFFAAERSGEVFRIELDRRIGGDVDPHMNVGRAAEVPDERWAFQSPVVPDSVVA